VEPGAGGIRGAEDCLDSRVIREVIVDQVEEEERTEGSLTDH